ncbi:MAG: thiamine phosphate synthase [Thermoproteota archaeon]|jgi:thiamine-phosphate pyrophosphorylase|nr:thiamine phosphate synthase [Thermoproteota archaeon]
MKGGLYLVVDASIEKEELLKRVEKALKGGVDILQLWSNWKSIEEAKILGKELLNLARKYDALLIINNDHNLALELGADGVHFDNYDILPSDVKKIRKDMIVGYTIGNNLERAIWAEKVGADYISFCACFPTSSVDSCEIVPLSVVAEAKRRLKIPVFASGGINLKNVEQVLSKGVDGIAVISAILKAEDPEAAARTFKSKILEYRKALKQISTV